MAARKTHDGLEFQVGDDRYFKTFDEAAAHAVVLAAKGQPDVTIDVLCWNVGAARFYAGDDGAERYNEDPEASVFERLEVSVNNVGMVP